MTKIGVYAGSFDPLTLGHIDIIKSSLDIFDVVHVARGSSSKKFLFSNEDYEELTKVSLIEAGVDINRVVISIFSGLLVKYCQDNDIKFIIRGLRAGADFDYEFNINGVNSKIDKTIKTVFFMCPHDLLAVSSSSVKELAKNGLEDLSWAVTPNINKALNNAFL